MLHIVKLQTAYPLVLIGGLCTTMAAQCATPEIPLLQTTGDLQLFGDSSWLFEADEALSLPLPGGLKTQAVQRPLIFERNEGQSDASVAFLSRGRGCTLFLAHNETVLSLRNADFPVVDGDRFNNSTNAERNRKPWPALRMRLSGASPRPVIGAEEPLRTKVNYFIGNQPSLWHTGIPTFGKVCYHDVYPGIDLVYYGNEGQLEYDFVVQAGADPNQIAMEFEGADGVRVDGGGDLLLRLGDREVRWQKPTIFQQVNGVRREIAGQYRILQTPTGTFDAAEGASTPTTTEQSVSFELAAFDARLPLIIDPILVYSTYLGGTGGDSGGKVALDGQGNVYVAGPTSSTDFPTRNALYSQNAGGPSDVYVAKFNPAGELLFSTYLGGSDSETWGGTPISLAVAPTGQSFVTGVTLSWDFPLTNAIQPGFGGGTRDAFVASLTAAGDALVFSTYLGGSSEDAAQAVAVGPNGDVYVGGYTRSSDFPTFNAFQPALSPPASTGTQFNDAFLTRLSAEGTNMVYSTFDGQSGTAEMVSDIAVAPDGSAFSALYIQDLATGGGSKWAAAKFNPNGTRSFERRWPTVVTQSIGYPFVALAPNDIVVLAGDCWGPTLPAINAPSSGTASGYTECYIALFGATNGTYRTAAYLGGSGNDGLSGVQVDVAGDLVAAGWTAGPQLQPSGFPVLNPLVPGPTPGVSVDVFVAKYRLPDLKLTFSTLFGGPADETTSGMALDARGNPWVAGLTGGQLPTKNAFQSQPAGDSDAFLVNLSAKDATLRITRSGQNVTLSWPLEAEGYIVETTASLPSLSWTTVTNIPTVTASEYNVELPITGVVGFFRLKK